MLDTVKINHVQHISFTQSRLTDAVSVILSELLSYEHPSKRRCFFQSQYWLLRLRSKHSRQYTGRSPLGWKGTWVVQPQPSQITS